MKKIDKIRAVPPEQLRAVRPDLSKIEKVRDPWERLRQADDAMVLLKRAVEEITRIRREAMFELHDELGHSDGEVAEALGTSTARVRQLVVEERKIRGLPNRRAGRGGKPADPTPEHLRQLRHTDPKRYEAIRKMIAKSAQPAASTTKRARSKPAK